MMLTCIFKKLKEILLRKILPQPEFEPGISLPFRGGRFIQFDRRGM